MRAIEITIDPQDPLSARTHYPEYKILEGAAFLQLLQLFLIDIFTSSISLSTMASKPYAIRWGVLATGGIATSPSS